MKMPERTGKYKVVIREKATGYEKCAKRWYFENQYGASGKLLEKGGFSINPAWELVDWCGDPIKGTTKDMHKPLIECPDPNFEEFRAAIFRQAVVDATFNVVDQKPLVRHEPSKKSPGHMNTIKHPMRKVKDEARRWLYFKGYEWLTPGEVDVNEIRMRYRQFLIDEKRTKGFNGRGCRARVIG